MRLHCRKLCSLFYSRQICFSSTPDIKTILKEVIPQKQQAFEKLKKDYGDKVIGKITINASLGGMRGVKALFFDQSTVDPIDGLMIRGYSIPELHELLPKLKTPKQQGFSVDQQPLPEGVFFLLLTGKLPSQEQVEQVKQELFERSKVTASLTKFINSLDVNMHPMTMFDLAILYEQQTSKFSKLYSEGKLNKKTNFWEYTYEDSYNIIAKLPVIASIVYRHKYKGSKVIEPLSGLDWSGQLAYLLGFKDNISLNEYLRGYLTIHSDHEGGEVATHSAHLAGSALSDPYLCMSNTIAGLAGPLHGSASSESLKWVLNFIEVHGTDVTNAQIQEYVEETISSGKIVPGYGHTVLKRPDPRFLHLYDFSNKYLQDNELIHLLHQMTNIVPKKLKSFKNISNAYPNVDSLSGALLYSLGIKEYNFYSVLFAISRAIGAQTNLVWSRAFGLPIENPESMDIIYYNQKFDPVAAAADSEKIQQSMKADIAKLKRN